MLLLVHKKSKEQVFLKLMNVEKIGNGDKTGFTRWSGGVSGTLDRPEECAIDEA